MVQVILLIKHKIKVKLAQNEPFQKQVHQNVMNALLEHILGRVQLIVFLVLSGQNQVERVLLVNNVQKELIQAQVLLFVIPVPQADILPQVHQHVMFVH